MLINKKLLKNLAMNKNQLNKKKWINIYIKLHLICLKKHKILIQNHRKKKIGIY